MHTIILVLGGLVLLALAVGLAHFMHKPFRKVLPVFLVIWFLCSAVNLWIGMHYAGYTFLAELPIFLVIFGGPALAAVLVSRVR